MFDVWPDFTAVRFLKNLRNVSEVLILLKRPKFLAGLQSFFLLTLHRLFFSFGEMDIHKPAFCEVTDLYEEFAYDGILNIPVADGLPVKPEFDFPSTYGIIKRKRGMGHEIHRSDF